jgi:anti-sigma factor RsiW
VSSTAGSLPLAADCFISRLHLPDLVDGELDGDAPGTALREVILEHLVACPRCARLAQQLRAFRERLHRVADALRAEERMSDDFRARAARLLAG